MKTILNGLIFAALIGSIVPLGRALYRALEQSKTTDAAVLVAGLMLAIAGASWIASQGKG
jgi:hypothetical protein